MRPGNRSRTASIVRLAIVLSLPAALLLSLRSLARTGTTRDHGASSDTGRLELNSPDDNLNTAFAWARRQALAYAFSGDPVGDWYEAALPGREAFCMRDVSHQSMGAHALGLGRHTRNMLRKFAENISESKDWCSFWEINRYNLPAPADYHDDADFWYNLPANFDVLDACFRMYVWSGDRSYFTDPAFANFYRRTAHEYVERWDLSLDRVMTRQRIMNVRGRDARDRFQRSRGIPGYAESDPDFVVAIDQIAAQYSGYLAYARFAQLLGNEQEASLFLKRAAETRTFLNQVWWDAASGSYYSAVNLDHQLVNHGYNLAVLYYGAAEEGAKAQSVVNAVLKSMAGKTPVGIEDQSHLPEILYRYGQPDAAYDQILDLTRQGKSRREYPEVSYAVVGAVVTGLMGIELAPADPQRSLGEGLYVDRVVRTWSRLTSRTRWAELKGLPVRSNLLSVRHDGLSKTTLTNMSGPSLVWNACFEGLHQQLLADRKEVAGTAATLNGRSVSCTSVPVGAGETRVAQTVE